MPLSLAVQNGYFHLWYAVSLDFCDGRSTRYLPDLAQLAHWMSCGVCCDGA